MLDKSPFKLKENHIDFRMLSLWVMLICKDKMRTKMDIFWHVLTGPFEQRINCGDSDLKPCLKCLFDLAVRLPLEMNYERFEANKLCTKEKYDELIEDFIDTIFDYESMLSKKDFLKNVRDNWWAIFNSSNLRMKFRGENVPLVNSDGDISH